MSAESALTVVIATEHSHANLRLILQRLAPASHPKLHIIIVTAEPDAHAAADALAGGTVQPLRARAGSLIPQMWRDGIVDAKTPLVALLTAHCVPDSRWLDQALQLEFGVQDAAIGGYFSNPVDADATSWAIYWLRYAEYSQPASAATVSQVAADNAIYSRDAILDCQDLLPSGFWEPEYHRRFVRRGLGLRLDEKLVVIHTNCYSAAEFSAQRRAHGFQYGRDRATRMTRTRRILYLMATPAIAPLLALKVLRRVLRRHLLVHAPATTVLRLGQFVCNWAVGEARGVWHSVRYD